MDSNEERIAISLEEAQRNEAQIQAKRRQKEIQKQKQEAIKAGRPEYGGIGGGPGGTYTVQPSHGPIAISQETPTVTTPSPKTTVPSSSSSLPPAKKGGLKLKKKSSGLKDAFLPA
eukprot:TRINITY_DN1016_c0_g1_i2.p3 TRINITY_DN1016_c0_g1~~TRINITY_DN1016_c0_g1_i2.p3  ORF type:complete len:116 (-),score=29.88 TRINITY_DN1016_c0_g1_i2:39-386(-)